jgi:hypothetical protein
MASTYSTNLRLELIGTGEQQGTWGATTNTNLGTLLEEAIGGYVSVTVSDVGDTTLTTNNGSSDQARNAVINLTGTISAARNVICPAIEKVYIVKNATTGGFAVTFKVSGQTGVSIPNGETYIVYVDGTDVRQAAAPTSTGTIATQNANNVSITGGSISNATLSNVAVVANASSLGVRDSDGSHVLSIAAGSNLTANRTFTLTTGDAARTLDISAGNVTVSTAGASLIDDADASAQRTTLGLGTIATQNANNVSITGGSITGITDLALADGGTGASLSDPNANAILGWNDTAGVVRFFTAGTGISINATSNTISSTASSSGSLLRAPQILTSGTSYTTPAGCNSIYVELVGGGGGGGGAASSGSDPGDSSAGGGGGSGAYAAKFFSVSPSTAYSYAIGSGGSAGASSAGDGGTGGNTTFTVSAVTVTAGGGSGGGGSTSISPSASGGAGGTATNGDINVTGNSGNSGGVSDLGTAGTVAMGSGSGGASFFGGAGRGVSGLSSGGAGTSGGGGGGGSTRDSNSNASGGAGGAGLIRVWEFS